MNDQWKAYNLLNKLGVPLPDDISKTNAPKDPTTIAATEPKNNDKPEVIAYYKRLLRVAVGLSASPPTGL